MTLGNMRELGVNNLIATWVERRLPAHGVNQRMELPG
jgi:hypothetical protein